MSTRSCVAASYQESFASLCAGAIPGILQAAVCREFEKRSSDAAVSGHLECPSRAVLVIARNPRHSG